MSSSARELASTIPPASAHDEPLAIPGSLLSGRSAVVIGAALIVGVIVLLRGMGAAPASSKPASPSPTTEPTSHVQPAPEMPKPETVKLAPVPGPTQLAARPEAAPASEPQTAAQPEPAPASDSNDVHLRLQGLVDQARALEQAGKPRKAMELYEQAETLDPNAADVLSRLAFNYLNRGENQKANDYAARAVAIDATSSEGWIVLGAARAALGDAKAAREAYRKCVEVGKGPYVSECSKVAR